MNILSATSTAMDYVVSATSTPLDDVVGFIHLLSRSLPLSLDSLSATSTAYVSGLLSELLSLLSFLVLQI